MIYSLVILSLVAAAAAKPQDQQHPAAPLAASGPQPGGPTPIPIVSQTEEINPDGSFKFSYETANGIKVDQKGYLKDNGTSEDKIQVIEGSVSYTDNAGQVINLKYIADENGFQPEGDHIPKAPEGIAGALQQGAGVQQGSQGFRQGLQADSQQGLQGRSQQGLLGGSPQGLQAGSQQGLQGRSQQGVLGGSQQGLQTGVQTGVQQPLSTTTARPAEPTGTQQP